jgi:hypothetical protein
MPILDSANQLIRLISPILLLALLVACLPEDSTPVVVTQDNETPATPQRAPAVVESIDILQDDTFPIEIDIVARGHLPNDCTIIDQISQERQGSTFFISIDNIEYAGIDCPESRRPFEESVALDLIDLPAGIYVVDVNGLQGTFKLQRDNIRDDNNAVVGGLVWNDRCESAGPDDGEGLTWKPGCVDLGEGRYSGDGIRSESETGIGGVKVHLGAGICPSVGLATTLTASDGTFLFSGLRAGDYCLTAAMDESEDGPLVGEGLWTFPADAEGQLTISLLPGESNLDASFGWTLVQSAEEPVVFATPAAECSNKALFIGDVTVPDNTLLSPGEVFTKTWQLQNLGSCTWETGYDLVFAAGEQMAAADSVPLTITVTPGDVGEVSVRLTAPETPGEYRGEWKLADPDGNEFGIGPGSDRPFWVQILVAEDESAAG